MWAILGIKASCFELILGSGTTAFQSVGQWTKSNKNNHYLRREAKTLYIVLSDFILYCPT